MMSQNSLLENKKNNLLVKFLYNFRGYLKSSTKYNYVENILKLILNLNFDFWFDLLEGFQT